MEQLYGTGVALATPFTRDKKVDIPALKKLVEHCIEGGVDYLVVLGTTAETATLAKSEKQLVAKTIAEQNRGRLPMVIGIGGNNTLQLSEELKNANLGAYEAVLSVSPYYNRPTQEGIFQHFRILAEASAKPLILYNVPARTGSNVLPETVLRLARESDNILGIKEASGNMEQIQQIIDNKPPNFLVLSGDDFTALPTVLNGGAGVISVLGQGLPSQFSRMVRLGLNGEADEAYELHHALVEGMNLIFQEGNPAGIKALLHSRGFCESDVRLPLLKASNALARKIADFTKSITSVHA